MIASAAYDSETMRLKTLTDSACGSGKVTTLSYAYDEHGDIVSVSYSGYRTGKFSQETDNEGYVTKTVYQKGIGETQEYSYLYEKYGNTTGNRIPNAPLTKLYLPTGKKIKYEYDSLNRLKEKGIVTDTSEYYSELYTYEEGGYHEESVTGVFRDPSATTIKPDRETTFVSEVEFRGLSITDKYEYDLHGNISKRVTGGKEIRYTYDDIDRLVREDNAALNKTYFYEYDDFGNIEKITAYNYTAGNSLTGGVTKTYSYDTNKRLTSVTENGVTQSISGYDALGNPTTYRGKTATWVRGRKLTSFNGNTFTYDASGRRLSKNNIKFYYDSNGNLLKQSNGLEFYYDAVGNPTTYRGKAATWVRGRKLISFNGNTFTYDASGRRLSKNNIKFYYDSNGNLLKQSNGLEFYYDVIGIAAIKYNGAMYLCRKDLQGNIIALIDNNGNTVVQYNYDAWGNHKVVGANGNEITDSTHIGNLNPFRYRGYYYDVETGLYFLQTRYYDPEVGRFLNRDSIIFADPEEVNGLNLYAYCLNNPINYIDPLGKFVISIGAALVMLAGGLFASFAAPIIVDAAGDIADQIINSVESINIPDIPDVPDINDDGLSVSDGNSNITSSLKQSVIKSLELGTLSAVTSSIFLSRERNRGHDSGFIGQSNQDLIDKLNQAKQKGDSKLIQRILKEMKMRGMRNARKNRNNPHMRGWFLLLLLGLNKKKNYEN